MKVIIMKFGGSSLAEPEKIRVVAERAVKAGRKGFSVVIVVSAPADITDDLIGLSRHITPKPAPREFDALISSGETISSALMAMAVTAAGAKAVSLSGSQARIRTDSRYGDAGIISVDPARILRELKKSAITVIAGFQGVTGTGDITTLGRGGSDLTAVVLARALKAEVCEFYTDVKGVYTANPAVVPGARLLARISYDAVIELARSGAGVRQLQAIVYAARHRIPLRLRSSFESSPGTLVGDFTRRGGRPEVAGFALGKAGDKAEISIIGSHLDSADIRRILDSVSDEKLSVRTVRPGKITLLSGLRDGEHRLKALHRVFLEQPRRSH
jgi:aspartate kinase